MLIVSISSCSNLTGNRVNNPKETSDKKELRPQEDVFQSLSAIKDVMQNKKTFTSNETNQRIFLKDFHSENYLIVNDKGNYEYTQGNGKRKQVFNRFCWIDLNGDKSDEILLETESSNIFLLHYEKGVVYGDVLPFRGMLSLKKDGSFGVSGGAAVQLIGKFRFSNGKCLFEELCCFDASNEKAPIYRINGNAVNKSSVEACLRRQEKKENAEWQSYNMNDLLK